MSWVKNSSGAGLGGDKVVNNNRSSKIPFKWRMTTQLPVSSSCFFSLPVLWPGTAMGRKEEHQSWPESFDCTQDFLPQEACENDHMDKCLMLNSVEEQKPLFLEVMVLGL